MRIQKDFIEDSVRVGIGIPIRTLTQPYLNPNSTLSEVRMRYEWTKVKNTTGKG
jgi:hypothetical protein